jgi:hypothetical protein
MNGAKKQKDAACLPARQASPRAAANLLLRKGLADNHKPH